VTTSRRPTRATVEGRPYLDLQNLARRQQRPTDELHQLYALEGFLARLARSPDADRLVLKGGVLLAAYNARRPTRDIDIQARAIAGDRDDVLQLVRDTAAGAMDDGLVFDTDTATADIIRDDDDYSAVRINLTATLASAKLSLHIDVNIGDPIWPTPRTVHLPKLLGGTITLAGYPLSMVYAEKIITALQRGTVNTRWRDFADIYILTDATRPRKRNCSGRLPRSPPTGMLNCHHSQTRSTDTPPWARPAGQSGDAGNISTAGYRRRSRKSSTRSSRSPIPRSRRTRERTNGIPTREDGIEALPRIGHPPIIVSSERTTADESTGGDGAWLT
jgi:Nucleotidyl transferase AbiEii toxin, Type IV TA system